MLHPSPARLCLLSAMLAASVFPAPLLAKDSPLELKLDEICGKYEGKPIFDSSGHTSYATCKWIREMAATHTGSPFSGYHKILAAVEYVDDVGSSPSLPRDLSCEVPVMTTQGRELQCSANLGLVVPVLFVADRNGLLQGVRMTLRYRDISRIAAENAVTRGRISKYYDAFVGATAEVNVAVWDANRSPGDTLKFDGNNLEIYVASQRPSR